MEVLSRVESERPDKFLHESLARAIREPFQALNTKAQLFEIFVTAFVVDRYELIPSRDGFAGVHF